MALGIHKGLRVRAREEYIVLVLVGFITIFGLAMLGSASFDLDKIKFNDTYYHLKHQIIYGLSFGVVGFFIGSRLYYRYWEKLSVPIMILGLLGVVLTFSSLGIEANGASRWIRIGSLSTQPSEFLKLAFVIYLSALFAKKGLLYGRNEFKYSFIPFLVVTGLIGGLLFTQPSTGTAVIVLGSGLCIYLVSGARLRYIGVTLILGAIVLIGIIYATPYRLERVKSFLSPESNIEGSNYQLNQALNAIGSGGMWGVGYGHSTTKYKYLPEPIGDSIFAVIAEEFGFVGTVTLLAAFTLLVIRFLIISSRASDKFGKLFAIGSASLITIQAVMHIGANSGLLPLTGVPLPFISYGGTSLAVFLTMSGIVRSIAKYG